MKMKFSRGLALGEFLAGFDGKALVELKNRHAKSDAVARHINIGLYSRTGNYVPWK